MASLTQLRERAIWERFVVGRTLSRDELNMLKSYDTFASTHLRWYFEGVVCQSKCPNRAAYG